ncbi:hypothetical protein RZS08_06345, partial [Arthrospira platensis SPKY1]|nr:hypothetical protein [Arthrospira platensis SPKY1]
AIPPALERTLVYQVELFFTAPDGQRRLITADGGGVPTPGLFLDRVRLAQPATRQFAADLAPASPLHLAEAEFAPAWRAGASQPVTLTWAAAAPAPIDYQVFAHLRQPETGAIVAQADGPPVDGWYPTSWWEPGELVPDVREFALPADLAPGAYRLVVGLYDLAGGARPIPEIELGWVEVTP